MRDSLFVCPSCQVPVLDDGAMLRCPSCAAGYPIVDDIADFSGGEYYDRFDPSDTLLATHAEGLELEIEGSVRRIRDFYLPLIRRFAPAARRVLDCGCGNGISVDVLNEAGFEAWGNDVSQLRRWQWRERWSRNRLVVASGLALPFPDGYFDVVLSSGVVEHIGVEEVAIPRYGVRPRPDRDQERIRFLRELGRVTAPSAQLFIDCPNGAFPIDFWHGDAPGKPRFHSADEGFLPTFRELRRLIDAALPGSSVQAHSPYKRLQFQQSARHWYGRLLQPPMAMFFRAMTIRPLRFLASSPLNPFLVVRVANPAG